MIGDDFVEICFRAKSQIPIATGTKRAPINIRKIPKNQAGASTASGSRVVHAYGCTKYTKAGKGTKIINIENTNNMYDNAFIKEPSTS